MSFNLSGYKPAKPSDDEFEPFKYEGPARINKAVLGVNDRVDSEFYPRGCNQIEIEAVVVEGEHEGRKLWKRFNLDSKETKKEGGKTPVQKLADQLFAVGLEFTDLDSLRVACAKLVEMTVAIKARAGKMGDGRRIQIWNIVGTADAVAPTATGTVAF